MSPAARLFHLRLERRAANLAPELRSALVRGYARLRLVVSDADLETFIRSPSAERLLSETLTPPQIDAAFAPVSRALRDGVEAATKALAKDLPGAAKGVAPNPLSPQVVQGIRELNTRVMTTLGEDTRETVRAFVENGLRDGRGPKDIARGIRDILGLAPNQEAAVRNFRRMLEEGDAEALTRLLRDRRFDGQIEKAFAGDGLSEAQIDKMTAAYRQRFVAFHAETVARTASLDAQRLGQRLTWEDAVARGEVDGSRLTKRWSGVLDDRERPTHLAMEGETVPWDRPYSNGQDIPGDDEYNCRCLSMYSTTATPKAGAGAKGIPTERLRVGELLRAMP